MTKVKISGNIQSEKKQLVDILLKKANLTTDDVIDNAFTLFIRANTDLITEKEKKAFGKFLVTI
jgi:RNA-binding protein YhbY